MVHHLDARRRTIPARAAISRVEPIPGRTLEWKTPYWGGLSQRRADPDQRSGTINDPSFS